MITKPSTFDGGKNDPFIKSGAVKEMDKFPSRFSLFIPVELNALEAALFSIINSNLVKKEYVDVVRCLQYEIRLEQERIMLCKDR